MQQHIVRHYYLIIPVGTAYSASVYLRGGEMLSFDNRFSRTKKLGQVLQERLAAAHLPECMAEIQAGKRVEFGALSLDQEGLMEQLFTISRGSEGQLISTLQDIRNGKETEIDSLNLEIARVAENMTPGIDVNKTKLLGTMILLKSLLHRRPQ